MDHLPAVCRPLAYHLRLPPALEINRDLFAYAAPPFLNAVVLRRFDYRGLIALRLRLLVLLLLLLLLSESEVGEDLGDARDRAGRTSGSIGRSEELDEGAVALMLFEIEGRASVAMFPQMRWNGCTIAGLGKRRPGEGTPTVSSSQSPST